MPESYFKIMQPIPAVITGIELKFIILNFQQQVSKNAIFQSEAVVKTQLGFVVHRDQLSGISKINILKQIFSQRNFGTLK